MQKLPIMGGTDKPYYAPLAPHQINIVISARKEIAVDPDRIHYATLAPFVSDHSASSGAL